MSSRVTAIMKQNNPLSAATAEKQSTLRRFGQHIHVTRLGDMLVSSGFITAGQLDQALSYQKYSKKPIGETLIALGFLSPVQLYKKLAEQWCLRLSAAGLTLMLNVVTPFASARADDNAMMSDSTHVRLAAAFAPAAMRPEHIQPRLFGTTEIISSDISEFTKWTAAIKRFEDQMRTLDASPRLTLWQEKLQELKSKTTSEQIDVVNEYMNNITYIEDCKNYARSDYWATPLEFLAEGGDCEDYAIAKYASLRALGFSTDQLRIAIVHDKIKNIAHAVLIVYTDDGAYVLDNQNKRVLNANDVTRYKPIFSINSSHWWLHQNTTGV